MLDRAGETTAVEGVLAAARGGLSGVLVLRGDAGMGKTVLLEWAAGQAEGMRLARVAGVQAEMGLGFAGLHQLLIPFLDGLEGLPGPQRQALESAFGLAAGPAPDRFLVALAALTLLTDAAAAGRPVLCLVEDAQWLDQVSVEVLGFIARRLYADPVGMVFAVREGEGQAAALAGLPELMLAGLPEEVAGELLAAAAPAPVDAQVSAQVVAGVAGNPLALVEAAAELTAGELSGAVPLGWPLRFGGRLEELYLARVRALPDQTRTLLLVAAADPNGDPSLVYRAAGRLGIGPEAGEAAGTHTQRLVAWQPRVRFRHPLIRSAAYYAAAARARRAAHAALAAVTDAVADPDRRAWHRAEAAEGPDEQVAADLEHSAGRAQARGGLAAAAAFLERAAALTPDPARRAERTLDAAQADLQAGAFGKARDLLAMAESGPLGEFPRAHADLVRAQLAWFTGRGAEAPPLLLKAARKLEFIDPGLSRATYLDAISAAMFAGRLAGPGSGILEVASAASAAPPTRAPRAPDLLLDGLTAHYNQGYTAGVPMLREALARFGVGMSAEEELHWLWLASVAAMRVWDYDRWDTVSARHVQLARETGALSELPLALASHSFVLLFGGELAAAAVLAGEMQAVNEATGSNLAPYGGMGLAALQGDEAGALALIHATLEDVARRGEGAGITFAEWANAMLNNGLGHFDKAAAAAQRASSFGDDLGSLLWTTVELIEAAARAGMTEAAASAYSRLSEMTSASDSDWGLGIRARSRALLSEGDAAERLYCESIVRLGRTRLRVDLARAHLLYGEWLRRQRRSEARDQLRTAFTMFDSMGMAAFATRAGAELRATGERARPRSSQAVEVLTPQEEQIARLVAEHLTNREIAARLFISASTVEYHLRKIFRKLGVGSRTQLARTIQDRKEAPVKRG